MFLIFDTETTGLPKNWKAPISDTDNWPRCIQIAWQLHDELGNCIEHQDYLVKAEGFDIPYDAEKIHGISTDLANQKGISLKEMLTKLNEVLNKTKFIVGQNVKFDLNIIGCEFIRLNLENKLQELPVLDTCTEHTASLCKIPGGRGGKFKLPTLTELHQFLFNQPFAEAHNATADVEATTRCFLELIRKKQFTSKELQTTDEFFVNFNKQNQDTIPLLGLKHINLKKESEKIKKELEKSKAFIKVDTTSNLEDLNDVAFSHLHNHSQFSVLQSTISVQDLVKEAVKHKMPAVALTDHANLMGCFHFINAIDAHNSSISAEEESTQKPIKGILGCEFFVCENHQNKDYKDNGYQIVLLAKTKKGYHNLAKLSSQAFTDGYYYVPRIDKELIQKYKEDLIVLSGNLYGEVPSKILNIGEKQAEEALIWWKEEFKDDFYIELMRHQQEDEDRVNETLVKLAQKHKVKLIATNNTYYAEKENANAHDILLCVKDGEKQATPIGRGRGYRYGLPNSEYYFKSSDQMKKLFKDYPDAIINTNEIVDKIESYTLKRDVLLPAFNIPDEFKFDEDVKDDGKRGENAYLQHITYKGAEFRYGNGFTDEIKERIDFELDTIEKTGYPGYFLIVEDFIREARKMDVSVGPGRGSAAGSVVAYCLKITNIDPLKYDLLFERFLNPERISMPDIDIDFDDEGRSRVMDYVIDKYGSNQVAQIITYGTMAAKSAIRDTARVLDLPLYDADRIAKLIPNTKLSKIFGKTEKELEDKFRTDEVQLIQELLSIAEGHDLQSETVNQARIIEGSVRNTGIHACGVIITPDDITNFVPIARAKENKLYVTQFDNSVVEDAGLLKMDFLGLKTLTLIKDSVKIIKQKYNVDIDIDAIPIDDLKTYELFQRGETVGIFQYESPGMQKHLKSLKPTVFEDLIAMNALYRPGPMEYIPSFIERKHGTEEIVYDLDACEEYLKETYGITVYQEQVMLLSQKLAGFTKGEADSLRKGMGKKQRAVIDKMFPQFLKGGIENGHNEDSLKKIWTDWEAFASYAFNKSHSTCYAWIAYQTAYLKANYPSAYMAAVLSNNMKDIKTITFFMEECKRMSIDVLGPCVNESEFKFTVNQNDAIRFGMGAIKGVGGSAVETIVEERENGIYYSIFDLSKRLDLRAANKKSFENLALAGAFDSFSNTHRAQYFNTDGELTYLEKAIRFGAKFQERQNSNQMSLFGGSNDEVIPEPVIPDCDEWNTMFKLKKEKEVVGMYISGHPLNDFKYEIKYLTDAKFNIFSDVKPLINRKFKCAGIVTSAEHLTSKRGDGFGKFTIEDFEGTHQFMIFKEDYLKFRHFLVKDNFVYLTVLVKEGWRKKDGTTSDPRVMITHVELLQDILKDYTKGISFKLKSSEINNNVIDVFKELFENYKGDKFADFEILNPKEKITVKFKKAKQKIEINHELLGWLDHKNISFKIKMN